jgi:glutamate dehydrogenase
MEEVWKKIEALDSVLTADKQSEIMMLYLRLLRRVTRWFLRSQRMKLDITKLVKLCMPAMEEFKKAIPSVYSEIHRANYDKKLAEYIEMGVPKDLAHELTITPGLFASMDILEVAQEFGIKIQRSAELYFGIEEYLDLSWIRTQIIIHPTDNHWESLSREALRDDLDWQQRQLTAGIIRFDEKNKDIKSCLDKWSNSHLTLVERWRHILANLRSSSTLNYTMFFVAIRELLDLTQTTMQVSENQTTR